MSNKIYRSAMGKAVDLGALLLQNENVRAVGNMNVNARGDIIDSANRVIEPKNRQVQRHYQKQTNVTNEPVAASVRSAKSQVANTEVDLTEFSDLPEDNDVVVVKQELDKTPRQQAQSHGLKRI